MIDFMKDYRMTINGRLESSKKTFSAYNPATKAAIAHVPDATKAQLDVAVSAARLAQIKWRETPLAERQAALDRIGQAIESHAEELMSLLTIEQGKPHAGAEWEILGSAIWCREIAKQSLNTDFRGRFNRHFDIRF
ncbi:MAG TPA: aldehyde dehydrogenase family protein [Smithellaceae bacterium]|nr:aldehyde dehydrogenase family protein [Smithellaceae bacterium]